VERVLDQVELPVMLYNIPVFTTVNLDVETFRYFTKHSKIVGIKDSSGDLESFAKICKLKEVRPDWTIMIGPEHLLVEAIKLGADGGVNGGANVEPELFVSVFQAAVNGENKARVKQLMARVDAFQNIYQVGTPGCRMVTATKFALSLKNICSEVVAEPLRIFSSEERDQVKNILDGLPAV
jgi:4-hydroxy-tetrahydrodipicolinate synthase